MPYPQRQRSAASAAAAASGATTITSSLSSSMPSINSRRSNRRSRVRNKHSHHGDDSEDDGFSTEESYPVSPRIDRDINNNLLPGMSPTTTTTATATRGETNNGSGAEESDGGWSDESGKNSDLGIGLKSPTSQYHSSPSSRQSAFARQEADISRYDSERPDPMEMDVSDDESLTHSALGSGSYLSKGALGGSALGGGLGGYRRKSLLDAPTMIETSPAVMMNPRRSSLTGLRSIGSPGGEGGGGGFYNAAPFGARPPSPSLAHARPVSPLGDDDDDDRPPTPPAPIHNGNRSSSINNGPATGYFGYRHIEAKAQPRQQPFIPPNSPQDNTPEGHYHPVDPSPTVPHTYGLGAFSLANNNSSNHPIDPLPNIESPSNNSTYSNESNNSPDRNRMMMENNGRGGNESASQRGGFGPPPVCYSTDKTKRGSTSSGSMDDDDIYMDNHEPNNSDNNNTNIKKNDYRGGRRNNRSQSPHAPSPGADRNPSPTSPSGNGSRTSRSGRSPSPFRDEGVSPGGRSRGRTPSPPPSRSHPPSPPASPYGYARDYNDFDERDRRSRSQSPSHRDRNLPPIVVGGSRDGGSTASLDHFKGDEARRSRAGRSHDETATMSYSEREAKRSRKTITWLVIGLACALISLAALCGGLFGALYFANKNSNDNPSSPSTIPPDDGDSPQATIAPSGPSGPLPNATFPDIPLEGNQTTNATLPPNDNTTTPLEPLEITNQALFDLVATASFDGGEAILVNESPQNMAYRWLQNEDTLTIKGGVSPTRHLRHQQQQQQQQQQHRQLLRNERIIQRYAMACFYYGAGGPGWIRDGWLNGNVNECEWPIDTPSDINCDTESNMVSIEFVNNRLSGQLVPEIGLLKKLVRLVIRNNEAEPNLMGGIPKDLKALKSIRALEITGNVFTQALPDNLFNGWKVAAAIDLSNNGLPGAIPSSIGQLGNCTQFIANKNQLSGNVPSGIVNMTSLEELDISENNITGAVTSEMCVALTTVPAKAIVDCDKVTCDCCEPCGGKDGARR